MSRTHISFILQKTNYNGIENMSKLTIIRYDKKKTNVTHIYRRGPGGSMS